jgi:hypothetical protein
MLIAADKMIAFGRTGQVQADKHRVTVNARIECYGRKGENEPLNGNRPVGPGDG